MPLELPLQSIQQWKWTREISVMDIAMLFHIAHGYFHRFLLVFSFGIPLTKPPKHTKPLKIFKCLVRLKHLLLFNCITIEFVSLLLTKNSIKSSLGVPGRCRPAVNVPLLNVFRIKYREKFVTCNLKSIILVSAE